MANHKFFMLFVMYIASTCIYSLGLIFFYFLHCMSPTATCPSEAGDAIPIMIMTITGVLFGLFTGESRGRGGEGSGGGGLLQQRAGRLAALEHAPGWLSGLLATSSLLPARPLTGHFPLLQGACLWTR